VSPPTEVAGLAALGADFGSPQPRKVFSDMSKRWLFTWFSLSLTALAPVALAYLDPASGTMFLQLVLGGVAGLVLIVKLYWHKLLGIFGVGPKGDDAAESEVPEDDDAQA
jgi:hypothetical protein